jgi:hypothetical protein
MTDERRRGSRFVCGGGALTREERQALRERLDRPVTAEVVGRRRRLPRPLAAMVRRWLNRVDDGRRCYLIRTNRTRREA